MARLASAASLSGEGSSRAENSPHAVRRGSARSSLSPSPEASISSDKENRGRVDKRKDRAKSSAPMSGSPVTGSASKRRRLTNNDGRPLASQAVHRRQLEEANDTEVYDPDQNQEERRIVRKGLRDLAKELNDSRAEYLQADSTGILDTLQRANEYYKSVKQTSDATIDSRLLVSAGDLAYKRTAQLALGDASVGVDVDEFVSKCISFMRRGPRSEIDEARTSSAEDEDEGDALNWDWLGRQICFPNNRRPAISGFLLGPLSVQRRVRQQTQRRARQQRANPADAIRPEELRPEDLEKEEAQTLTTICSNIRSILIQAQSQLRQKVEEEVTDDMTDADIAEVMENYGIADDGGVPLFRFCVNPRSFGQTIENLFYVSFLIRESRVAIEFDSKGFPSLHAREPTQTAAAKAQGLQRHQAVFSLDFDIWEEIIRQFNIMDAIIPHRIEEDHGHAATGWYS